MGLRLTEVEKTVSPAGSGYWVQVHDFTPEDTNTKTRRGRLVAIIGVADINESETMKLVELGREVLAFFHEQYYGDLEGGILDKLKKSITKIKEEFGEGVELAVLVEASEVMYLGFLGGAKAFIYQDGKSGILDGDRVFSGWKKLGMKVVLGTKNFWEKIGEGRIKALLESDKSCREMAEELGVVIGSDISGSGVGGMMIKVGEALENEIVEIENEKEIEIQRPNKWMAMKFFERRERFLWVKKINWGIVMLILMVLLIVGGGMLRKYKANNGVRVTEQIAEVEQNLKEASILADTNPSRAKEILESVKPILNDLKKLKNDKVSKLLVETGLIEEVVAGIVRLDFKEVTDLAMLREGLVIAQMRKAGKQILVLDTKGGKVVSYDLEKEKGEVVLGGEALSGTRMMAYYPGKVYVLGGYGVKECSMESWKCENKIENGVIPGGVMDMGSWGGNLYFLDGQEGRIWKYVKQKTSWMEADANLVGADSMAIDGKIWVAYLNGRSSTSGIGKYFQGVKENFEISGLEPALGKNISLYTSEDETKIYILDPANKRIVVVEKNGGFVKQFVAEIIGSASGLVVYEDKAQIYLSVGSKIYRADENI